MNTPESPLFRQTLASSSQNLCVSDWMIDHKALGLHVSRPFNLSKRTLHGGRQEGVELLVVDNGVLRIFVIPTRGMGIWKVEAGDVQLGWHSPVREIIHPRHINLLNRGGLGWLEGFNEWLVRCGLESAGAPGKDSFITNTGSVAEMDLTLHGKIANLPTSELEIAIDRAPPHRIHVRGRVDETMFYGPKLELWTELSLDPGADSFQVADVITNRAGTEQEFELIYHVNFGPPLLGHGARFVGALKRLFPMNAHAAQDVDSHADYLSPTVGFVEQVYCMEPFADDRGWTTVMLQNPAGDRAASLSFELDQLPCFTLWKNTNGLEEGYVTGFEPGTNFPFHRRVEREAGRLSKLKPGQSRGFVLEFGIHRSREAVETVARQIARTQGDQRTEVQSQPPRG